MHARRLVEIAGRRVTGTSQACVFLEALVVRRLCYLLGRRDGEGTRVYDHRFAVKIRVVDAMGFDRRERPR